MKIYIRNAFISASFYLVFNGLFGVFVVALSFGVLSFALPVFEKSQQARVSKLAPQDIEVFAEILILGTSAGLSAQSTLRFNLDLLPIRLKGEIEALLNRCEIGMSWTKSLEIMCQKIPELRSIGNILLRSAQSGSPIGDSLQKIYQLQRRQNENESIRKIRSVAVRCVLPLGLCFLPAFIILTIVPIVATLIPSVIKA
jgi:Flp pilus assembly protein TadB